MSENSDHHDLHDSLDAQEREHTRTPTATLTRAELIRLLNDNGCAVLNDAHGNLVVVLPDHLVVPPEQAPAEPSSTDDPARPAFESFAACLRAEARWSAMIHEGDKTGQAASDQRSLLRLAEHVEQVGRSQGFLPPKRS
jgi:hypothetical protein